jgi:beta-galactosidase
LKPRDLTVFDPEGSTSAFLKERQVPFNAIKNLKEIPANVKILLVGKDAIPASESASTRLAALALGGAKVFVLEQKYPLKYQAVQPAEMEAAENEGQIAFLEDSSHPLAKGLKQKDFFTWSPGDVVYRDAYLKPTRGARSIIQCHELLKNSALVEIPIGDGLLVLSQLGVGGHLADNAVARKLLLNMIEHGASYKLQFREVAVVLDESSRLGGALDALGLRYSKAADPLAALDTKKNKIAVISATPENLKAIAANQKTVDAYTNEGGTVVLHGLTPEGLDDYNKIVGYDHMVRPFRRERVLFPPARDPLTAGLSLSDVALFSSERIFPWQEGNYVASDIFSYVIDYDEVAPFAEFENDFNLNMVNGFVSADAWKYIVNVPAPENPPLDFKLQFPRPQTITEVEWIGNTFYYPVTKFALLFDDSDAATFPVKPNNDPQTFAVEPLRTGRTITLRLADWDKIPGKNAVTGLDNIRLKAQRSPEFYNSVKPMLNVGGLMHYPRGDGGIVLVNVLYKEAEDVPANAERKRAILGAILRNLQAPFTGGKTIIAGANLTYSAVDISKHANAFRTERGWFGDPSFSFKDLPTGRQTFAGVPYLVYDFPTSPVPTVIMLGGDGVPGNLPSEVKGIPVDRKVDALFFLQAARIDQRRNNDEIRDKKPFELARYVIHYADGKTADVPIYSEIDIYNYKQATPISLPGASIAWTRKYPGTDQTAVAYTQQWNNPRPDVPITSLDLVRGSDPRGIPALIADEFIHGEPRARHLGRYPPLLHDQIRARDRVDADPERDQRNDHGQERQDDHLVGFRPWRHGKIVEG